MANDVYTSLIVKTKTNGDVVAKIVDTSGSNILGVDSNGRITANMNFAGNADGQTATASGQNVGLVGYNGTTYDRLRVDGSKNLMVNVNAGSLSVGFPLPGNADGTTASTAQSAGVSGYNGTTYDRIRSYAANVDAVTSPTLGNVGTVGFNYGYNGTTWDRLQVDGSKYLKVNVAAGTLSVSFPLPGNSDGAAAAANQSTGISGFNGTTWDRLRSDVNKYLYVDIGQFSADLPAGNNIIGTVTLPLSGNADGQTALAIGQGSGMYAYNGTTWDRLRDDTNKYLYVDIGAINGAVPGAPVAAGSSATGNIPPVQGVLGGLAQPVSFATQGTLHNSGQQISAPIAVSSSQTISSGLITSGKVGSLQHMICTSSTPCRWDLQTVASGGAATILFSAFTTAANLTYEYKCQNTYETQTGSGDGSHVEFEVVATNQDNTTTAVAYATFFWSEQ